MSATREWRSPQLVRDNKPHRPGFPEVVTKVGRNEAIALLIGKLHGELYEIEMEPESAEEIADFLTVLNALSEVLSSAWSANALEGQMAVIQDIPSILFISICDELATSEPTSGQNGYGPIHHQIERLARNLLAWEEMVAIIRLLAIAARENNVSCTEVIGQYAHKWMKVGGFDGHLLWQSTEF